MKKIVLFTSVFCLLIFSTATFANVSIIENEADAGLELIPMSDLPEGITPILVDDMDELKALILVLDNEAQAEQKKDIVIFNDADSLAENLYSNELNNDSLLMKAMSSATPYNCSKVTTIFNLNDIGGRVEQKVDYIKWYFNDATGAGNYYMTVDDCIATTNGIYGFQEVTYSKNEAIPSSTGQSINCRVKGYTRVYVGIAGQGFTLKTFYFDKSYTIY
ncbi:hypothetical protein [Fusibacter sp. 3D3]|uniref:hypothetical protein n=1 Tax=Fusibacter sp. 3D3 TaxID=1048380 RepID=UPI0008531566|nr:hypothetical protein [Fusibacter sp. 3D3]GAU76234.1 hypothetical protein F3D3_0831 [Fusibacter sp. 3D3]